MNSEAGMNNPSNPHQVILERPLRVLTPRQISMVDLFLTEVGEYGQVRIILQKNRVRYIEKLQSLDVPT